jgi:hypothetical protein
MRFILAFRAFFAILFRRDVASRVRDCLEPPKPGVDASRLAAPSTATESAKPQTVGPTKSKKSTRCEAITLLSALQREARLLDLIGESMDQYSDAQIGSAARDVLRDSRKTLDRMFGIKPLVDASEGSVVEIPSGASPVRWRIIGKDSERKGTLSHPGWQATKSDMPQWLGSQEDALVIAAAEVET